MKNDIQKSDMSKTDLLAMERTRLANERTFLAYFRTFIVFLSSGIAIIKINALKEIEFIGYFLLINFSNIINNWHIQISVCKKKIGEVLYDFQYKPYFPVQTLL